MADNEEKLNYNEDKSKLIAKDIWKEEIPAVIEEETTLVSGLNKIFQSLFNRIKKVRTTFLERKILTGSGLSGGGSLSTDRILSVKRKDASINVENTGISVNRSNEYNTTFASEDVLLTQLGGKRLYNQTVANRNAINNNSDKIESLYEEYNIDSQIILGMNVLRARAYREIRTVKGSIFFNGNDWNSKKIGELGVITFESLGLPKNSKKYENTKKITSTLWGNDVGSSIFDVGTFGLKLRKTRGTESHVALDFEYKIQSFEDQKKVRRKIIYNLIQKEAIKNYLKAK